MAVTEVQLVHELRDHTDSIVGHVAVLAMLEGSLAGALGRRAFLQGCEAGSWHGCSPATSWAGPVQGSSRGSMVVGGQPLWCWGANGWGKASLFVPPPPTGPPNDAGWTRPRPVAKLGLLQAVVEERPLLWKVRLAEHHGRPLVTLALPAATPDQR